MVACDNAIKTRGHFEKLKVPVAVKACDGHDMSICCKKKIGTMVKHALLNMYSSLNNLRHIHNIIITAIFDLRSILNYSSTYQQSLSQPIPESPAKRLQIHRPQSIKIPQRLRIYP